MRCRMHASPAEAVSLKISEAARAVCAVECMRHPGSIFVDDFSSRMGCLRCRIHALSVEAVSLKISEAAGAVCAVESMGHEWKQFR